MSTLHQVRNGVGHLLDTVGEGWRHLRAQASQALTHFTPGSPAGESASRSPKGHLDAPRWSLLAADLSETDTEVTVVLEVPGMDKQDFELEVVDHTLSVRGEKRARREGPIGRFHVVECAYGRFERAIALPSEVLEDGADAVYESGVLRVTLPKARPRSRSPVKVEVG